MKDIRLLGDVIKIKLRELGIPTNSYILFENVVILVIASKISFFLPFSDIPITLQSLAVVMIGAVYGIKSGILGILVYLAMGLLGVPVFSGEESGYMYMMGKTGGFLLAFVPAIMMSALLANFEWDRDFKRSMAMLAVSQAIILFGGACWIIFFMHNDRSVPDLILPFIPGLVLKTILGAILLKIMWGWVLDVDMHEEEV